MSAEAERVFSGTRRQISWDKASLSGLTIEKMECLKHWLTKKAVDGVKVDILSDVLDSGDGEVDVG